MGAAAGRLRLNRLARNLSSSEKEEAEASSWEDDWREVEGRLVPLVADDEDMAE